MIDLSDDELVRRAQAGDRQAFGVLVDRYWPRIQRWLMGLTQSRPLSEDLAQDTFLKAWRGLGSFSLGTSFRAWTFRIARNGLIDYRRRERESVSLEACDESESVDAQPLEQVLHEETRLMIERACGRLPLSVREAFLLRTQEGLSFAEIAEALDSTEETVRWRVHKARQHLLKDLSPYLSPPGQAKRVSR